MERLFIPQSAATKGNAKAESIFHLKSVIFPLALHSARLKTMLVFTHILLFANDDIITGIKDNEAVYHKIMITQ